MAMNLIIQGLRMNEGTGDTSYAKTAYIQKQVLLSTKSTREEALKDFYLKNLPSTLCIADLGCSSAEQNTFTVALELIENIENARQKLGYRPLDYQVNLNDLPNNDFNTLFKSLEIFKEKLEQKSNELGQCFVCGVPGSFYGRLFPDNSLHFVHSSYSLHWLSQVPDGIEENKKSIYLSKASSTRVLNAYYEQFIEDFTTFLSCRSKEVIGGGKMQLTIIGRRSVQPFSKECSQVWDLLAIVLNEMTSEGFIEEKKLNTFNIPNYYPSPLELKTLVEREGSFIMDQINTFETKWNNDYENSVYKDPSSYDFVKCIRSVVETMLINWFGEEVIDEIFIRYQKVVHSSMIKEEDAFINHSLLLIKK
ncbi:hypothetical protein RND81_01G105600 [Saponaria officinalis]|uniref:Uncharacterized protein n=1 Tax=Saponaria officinalis TaxID=3572 RepID=A0AAW1N6P6_SAPOF